MNWNTALYDNSHNFVSKFGQGILSHLNPGPDQRILDLGCGTGDLAKEISLTGAEVVGVDSSIQMIQAAKSKFPEMKFYQMDARALAFGTPFDAIFSNAVLHWIPEKELVINSLRSVLKENGRLVVEFGGKGNVQFMLKALAETFIEKGYSRIPCIDFWYFPSIGEYASELEKQKFRVIHAEHFDRQTPLEGADGIKNWFRMFGDPLFVGIPEPEKEIILEEVQNKLRPTHFINGTWYADYKRIRAIAVKKEI